jgi:hypothetical protein
MTDPTHLNDLIATISEPSSRKLVETLRDDFRDPSVDKTDYVQRLKNEMEAALQEGRGDAATQSRSPSSVMVVTASPNPRKLRIVILASLMRAATPSSPFGFVLLDDPVQSMDDDHTESFILDIVPHLLDNHRK